MIWVEFSITALMVIFFGYKLSEKADRLAEIKGFGKGVVGFILLGFATSLPELIATVSSTLFLDNPDLGTGNIIGSKQREPVYSCCFPSFCTFSEKKE